MAVVAELQANFLGNTSDLDSAIARTEQGLSGVAQRVGSKMEEIGQKISGLGTKLVTTFGPFAAIFGIAFNKFASFDEAMRNAHSILGTLPDDQAAINQQILDMGSNSRAGPQAVAEAYYNIVSGVADTTVHMDLLSAAIATSEAGNADLMATTAALVGTMNAYGFAAEDAAFVSDVYTRSVQKGVLTMDELAGAMPNVTGIAASMNVPLEEVAASLSFMTTKGISASVASTQLRQAMVSLINPNETMKAAIEELGYASGEALIQELGLVGAMNAIASTSVAADEGLGKVWGSTEAYNAQLQLTTDSADDFINSFTGLEGSVGGFDGALSFINDDLAVTLALMERTTGAIGLLNENLGEVDTSHLQSFIGLNPAIGAATDTLAGTTDAARDIQMDGPAAQIDLLKSKIDELAIVVGETLAPALTDIIDKVEPIVEDFADWAAENPKLVSTIGLIVIGLTTLGAILIPIGGLISMGGTLITGLSWLAGASGLSAVARGFVSAAGGASLITTPLSLIGSVVGGVGSGLASGLGLMYTGLLNATTGFTGMLAAISPLLAPMLLVGAVVAAYVTDFGGFKTAIDETGEAIRDRDFAGAIQGVADAMIAIPMGLAEEIGSWIGLDVEEGLRGWKPVIDGVAGAIDSVASAARDALRDLLGLSEGAATLTVAESPNYTVETDGNVTTITTQSSRNDPDRPTYSVQDATGGMETAGTWALVGEQGPELVQFPSQARVYPHSRSRSLAGDMSGTTINGNVIVYSSADNISDLVDDIQKELNRRA